MKMKRKFRILLLVTCCLLVSVYFFSSFASAKSDKRTYQIERDKALHTYNLEANNGNEVRLPEIRLKGNKNSKNIKSIDQMKGYVKKEHLEKVNARILDEELLTYDQFLQKHTEFNFDPTIDSERMIWTSTVHYPEGVVTMRGIVKNAVLTVCYDAETGEDLGFFVTSLDKDGMNDLRSPY